MYNNNINIASNKPRSFFIYVLVAVFSFALGWQATSFGFFGDASVKVEKNTSVLDPILNAQNGNDIDMELFWTVWGELKDKYIDIDVVKDENMVYGAIKGMVKGLDDPFTVFMTPEESKQFNDSLEGKLEGIGAELTVKDKNLVIVSPLRKSPAEKAGLLSGDIIYKIDGEVATEMTLVDAIMRIRGKKGTTVTLTIIREDLDKPFDVSIVRDSIDIESVTVEKLDDDIVYISVNQFNEKTNDQFGKAISELILDEPKGLIVDLRYNGGGYLDIAVQLLSYLLPSNTSAVVIKERGKDDEIKYTNGNPKLLNVPLVVIVNDSSASASEILAGAIQDHERGVILGTKSFGKGSVQEVQNFTDGSSMRLTIAKWLTPKNRSIDHAGLIPDIIVEVKEEDIKKEYDAQKEAAVKYLKEL